MAYKIIQHRIVKPVEYAVHFKCSCGCEFWADQDSVKEYRVRGGLNISNFLYYETICPDCVHVVISNECAVPKDKAFTE